ncbi:MAG: ABC transporter transmembrane domain-containing protein, partial [Motiliproteus sp.]
MEPSIFRYILRHTLKDQILILILTLLSLPFLYAALEVPKRIINDAIGGANRPDSLFGYEVDQFSYLFVLCGLFLLLIIINGGIKYMLNVYRGVVGERMLRRLRFDLFSQILRFPIPHFKKISQGEIIPIITAETEPLGGFIGEAYALPAYQGGILLTYLVFIFNQDVLLGIVATALYPFQMYVIPKLQRKVNELGKQRVLAARRLGDRIGDSISGIQEIHVHDTSQYERAVISERLGRIYRLRFNIYKRKFFIKFLNNFLAQVTPFFFYLFGGYYIINGELSLGALVAVLAAYKDLSDPWKELLKFYQIKEDVRIKYEQIIDMFQPDGMLDSRLQQASPLPLDPQQQGWEGSNLSYSEQEGINLVERLNFKVGLDQHTAIVGIGASGKEELGQLMARLLFPSQGKLNLAGMEMMHLPESVVGRHLAYVGAHAHLFSGTIRDNLLYSLHHRQLVADDEGGRCQDIHDAERSGNSTDDPNGNWIDRQELGCQSEQDFLAHIHQVLAIVDFSDDLFQLGLLGRLDSQQQQAFAEQILTARGRIHQHLQQDSCQGLVELFDWNHYNSNLTVLENVIFSPSKGNSDEHDSLAGNLQFQNFLDRQGLLEPFLEMGRELTEMMVDLFSDIDEGSDLFERFSFIRAEDLPEYRELLQQTRNKKIRREDTAVCERFLSLTFKLTPARHRLGLVDEVMQQQILKARHALEQALPEIDIELAFLNSERFNPDLNIRDNLLFGRLVFGKARTKEKITSLIHQVICELSLENSIVEIGLGYEVGTAGSRLSMIQRQKLAIARAVIKKPDGLILNEALAALDPSSERQIVGKLREV